MKKLSKINLSASKALGNEELVNLRGGYETEQCDQIDLTRFSCKCVGCIGEWTACYESKASAENIGAKWCESLKVECTEI